MKLSSTLAALTCAVTISACATIQPTQVSLVADHVSHLSQHFGADPTSFGYEAVGVAAHWQYKRAYLDLSETYNLGALSCYGQGYAALWGPREVFSARVGLALWRQNQ